MENKNNLNFESIEYYFHKNMKFFKQNVPYLYEQFQAFQLQNLTFNINAEEEIEIIYHDVKLYPQTPQKHCEQQVKEFIRNPHEIMYCPSEYPPNDTVLYRHINKVFAISPLKEAACNDTIIPSTKDIPLMLIAGVGAGYHIQPLIEQWDIRHLIILEPELELFYLSLHTIDWEAIFNYFNTPDKSFNIHFFIHMDNILSNIRLINPVFINHAYVFKHFYRDEIIVNALIQRAFMLTHGFGFYDDEKCSLEHSLENLKNKIPILYPNTEMALKDTIPVFIVGAGPSLDDSVEVIKKYKDQAIIISCGSALITLEKEGIKPDFHMEIERTYDTYEALGPIDKNYLSELNFIGNNSIHPAVFELFEQKFMFIKANDAFVDFISEHVPHLHCSNPTVVNGAMALSVELGAENIYLFGVDMGTKNLAYHHSKYNVAMDENSKFFLSEMVDAKPVNGNFGGTVYTNEHLLCSKNTIEEVLALHTNVKAYNCSDGIKIENTIPLEKDKINLLNSNISKEAAVSLIKSQFKNDYPCTDINLNKFYAEIDNIIKMLEKKITDKMEIIDLFYHMYQYVIGNNLIRGSVLHFQNVIYSHSFLKKKDTISDDLKDIDFINQSFSIFREFLLDVKKDLQSLEKH